jgi:hypothetical protein
MLEKDEDAGVRLIALNKQVSRPKPVNEHWPMSLIIYVNSPRTRYLVGYLYRIRMISPVASINACVKTTRIADSFPFHKKPTVERLPPFLVLFWFLFWPAPVLKPWSMAKTPYFSSFC